MSIDILSGSPTSLLNTKPAVALEPEKEIPRSFGDVNTTRKNIYNRVLESASTLEPVSNDQYTLNLRDVHYMDSDYVPIKEQKKAILRGETRGRRLRGTWELLDNISGNVIDRKKSVLMTVPHLTGRGTYIHKGNEYTLRNQQRLRPGVFTRVKDNGEVEAHANVLPGKGLSHRYFLDPEKGVFYIRAGQAKLPLMPLLKTMGATDKQLQEAWGSDIFAANYPADEASAYKKLRDKFLNARDLEGDERATREKLVEKFENMTLDPEVTKRTLGKPYTGLNLDAVMDITKKLLNVSRGYDSVDDRDALPYQRVMGPEDLFSERIDRDYGQVRRNLLWKATGQGDLSKIPSSALKSQIEAALLGSGLGQALEEINPAEIYDKAYSISRMGEGGIPSLDAVPEEARSVQPSHMGFIDPVRTPESSKVGVDLYMARNVRKGRDGKIYAEFLNPKTGKKVWRSPQEISDLTVGFPGAMEEKSPRVPAMSKGEMVWVPKKNIDLILPNFEEAFSPLSNMIPMKSMIKGGRLVMGSRFITQALPLVDAEAPLVQSAIPGTNGKHSFEDEYSNRMGARRASRPGRVMKVDEDGVTVKYQDGEIETLESYNNFPFNRKTFIHQTPTVKPGDLFGKGQLLLRSNFTNSEGTTALGKNARVAYISWGGKNFEDAIVISEGFAKRLRSEHMYQHDLDVDDKTDIGKKKYISLFPGKYDRDSLAKLDANGVIKPGVTVEYGDPLVLATQQRETAYNKVHRKGQAGYADASILWDHHDPGVVTDVELGKKGPVVVVKSFSDMRVGDKLSGRYGDKGVIADIIADDQMPHDADGEPFEVLLNPLGIITRTNPAQTAELYLGKLAAKQGAPIKVQDFDTTKDMSQWVLEELRKAGLSDLDDIYDPTRDRKINDIATGNRFFMKLHHTAESKGQARGGGAYSAEGAPAKGGSSGSKRIALLDTNALLSHGATENIRDVGAIRGQRNEDYWLQFMSGVNPKNPKVPMVYQKFVNQLRAAGVNVKREGTQTHIMALTDKDVDQLAGSRNLESADGVDWNKGLKPLRGGLFDPAMTGGHNGVRWSAIKLVEPMPNPVMEEPIRRLLGLTQKDFQNVISGEKDIVGFGSGPRAIQKALSAIDLDKELAQTRAVVRMGKKTERDQAIRKLGYLKSAKKLGIEPKDWILKRAPVLPPSFRPVNMMSNNIPLINDANFLYKELFEANKNLSDMQTLVGEDVGEERLAVYNAFKAVTGLGDPISQKSRDKNIRGILKDVFGSSPKFGTVQRKLISTTVDNVGRAVITPNPSLDMDSVGLPEDKAFDVYQKFIIRDLKRKGLSIRKAMEHIKERSDLARESLLSEMDHRPVIINRAPVLHKFGIMAFRPQLTKGDTLQVSPLIVSGFNADFDGDAMNYHVPTTEEARKEALDRLLPSKNLLSPADFKRPVHSPSNEYAGGLWYATKSKSRRAKKIFNTMSDMRAAYERGDLSLDDHVQILRK
jgi:DNA-directed RNA polymerase subunit beta